MHITWKPTAPRWILNALSGLVWSGVGLLLLRWVWVWLSPMPYPNWIPSALAGIGLALLAGTGFSWMAKRNLLRLERLPDRPCIFAFQRWTSYPLVVFMIVLGVTLRHSLLPRTWLAPVYLGIGGGLFLASLLYFQSLIQAALKPRGSLGTSGGVQTSIRAEEADKQV
jgi:hypothetical protein